MAVFKVMDAARLVNDPPLPLDEADDLNIGVGVLCVDILPGQHTVAVLFSPRWNVGKEVLMPPLIPLSGWNLTSHLSETSKEFVHE